MMYLIDCVFRTRQALLCLLLFAGFLIPAGLLAQGAGSTLDFDGVDEYVDMGSPAELLITGDITIEAWVYMDVAPGDNDGYVICGFGANGESTDANNVYRLAVGDTDAGVGTIDYNIIVSHENAASVDIFVEAVTPPVFGEWMHIAVIRDVGQDEYQFVINGDIEGIAEYTSGQDPFDGSGGAIVLGAGWSASGTGTVPVGGFLDGRLDEVRIWDTQISTAAIQSRMHRRLRGSELSNSNLQGYWRLDDGSGTNADDSSDKNNDGTLMNMEGGDWVTSTAPVGDDGIHAESADVTETVAVPIDVTFGSGLEAPGADESFGVIQVNEAPNNTTGILGNSPTTYWELWSENDDFDGDFTATVLFHFDNVPTIGDEANLNLYTRADASGTWTVMTVDQINDEGDNGDNIGSVQITLNELSGFRGQFILASTDPDNPLPVSLSSFSAVWNDRSVQLDWTTESEVNNLGFELWRSVDDSDNFQLLTSYRDNPALEGAGTTNSRSEYQFVDGRVDSERDYFYQLWDVALDGTRNLLRTVSVSDNSGDNIAGTFVLEQNYPNPFNPTTVIRYSLSVDRFTSLSVYDITGQAVATLVSKRQAPGSYSVTWDGRDDAGQLMGSGVYIYRLSAGTVQLSKRMILVR